jgi:hypothetical protein
VQAELLGIRREMRTIWTRLAFRHPNLLSVVEHSLGLYPATAHFYLGYFQRRRSPSSSWP